MRLQVDKVVLGVGLPLRLAEQDDVSDDVDDGESDKDSVALVIVAENEDGVPVHVGVPEAVLLEALMTVKEDVVVSDRDCVIDMEGVIVHVGTCVHVTVVLGDAV